MRFVPIVVIVLWLPAISRASDGLLKRGIGEYARGKFKQAVATLTDAVQKGRDQKGIATARKYLAAVHAALGDPASARGVIEAALKVDPTTVFETERFPPALVKLFANVRDGMKGTIEIACNRDDALVEVVGQSSGRCGATFEVVIGAHTVRANASGEKAADKSVVVFHKSRERVDFRFTPAAGFLSVTTTPPGAAVTIDDEPAPRTPFARHKIAAGARSVRLRLDGYEPIERQVVIARDAEVPLAVTLAKSAPLVRTTIRVPVDAPPPPLSKARKTTGWSFVTVGALSLAAGVVLQLNVVNERSGQERSNTQGGGSYSSGDAAVLDSRDKVAKGLFIAGGALTATGALILLWRTAARASSPVSRIPIDVGVALTSGGRFAPEVRAKWAF